MERHGSSQMSAAAWLEIPDFAVRFAAAWLSGTFKYLFLIILLISPKHDMLIAAIPFVHSGPAVRRHLFILRLHMQPYPEWCGFFLYKSASPAPCGTRSMQSAYAPPRAPDSIPPFHTGLPDRRSRRDLPPP